MSSEHIVPHWRDVLFTTCGWIVTFVQMASLIAFVAGGLGGYWVYGHWDVPRTEQRR